MDERLRRIVAQLPLQTIKEIQRRASEARSTVDKPPLQPPPGDATVPLSLSQARQLELATERTQRASIPMSTGSDAHPPLFLIHDVTGDVWPLHPLARQLPDSLTVFGLELPSPECLASIELLATAHVCTMRSKQPHGPYRLAGHSVGGVVACEVARQLLLDGESVGFVGLIDAVPTNPAAAWDAAATGDVPLLLKFFEYVIPDLPAELLADIRPIQDFEAALLRCKQAGLLSNAFPAAEVRRWIGNVRAALQASARYQPAHIAAPCVFFESDEQQWIQAASYWRSHLGEHLRVVHVGGSHFGIIRKPRVETVAQEIAQALGISGQQK